MQTIVPDVSMHTGTGLPSGEPDLYIWDLEANIPVPPEIVASNEDHKILFLASQSNLATVDPDLLARTCVLLKPINAFTLRTFIDLAARTWDLGRKAIRAEQLSSDRESLVEYVLAANLRLQEYDHQRTNFLARALHDFRAPLTALHGYCGLLADGEVGQVSPQQQELLRRMQNSTRRLSRQATGMFELSVLGHVRRKPQLIEGDIEDAVAQAVHEVQPLAQEKGVEITVQVEPPETRFLFEPELIVQVLVNILENSGKYAPVGGVIELRGYPAEGEFEERSAGNRPGRRYTNQGTKLGYRIDIQDNGPGIQTDLLPTIFEEYTSYSGGRDRSGGGLGLAICKMIVDAHQGSISASNYEQGARFSFVLPLDPSQPMAYSGVHLEGQLA